MNFQTAKTIKALPELDDKLWNAQHRPEDVEAAIDETLKDLGTDSPDLYLMHWLV